MEVQQRQVRGRLAAGVTVVVCEKEVAPLFPAMPCRGDGVCFCPLALGSSAYSVRSWESDGFGCCWGKQRDRRDQRAPAWGGQAGQEQSWTCSALAEPRGP